MYKTLYFLLLLSWASFAKEVPKLTAPIMDQASIISSRTESQLNRVLKAINQQALLQMAILTVEDLEDESLEGYSIKVVDQWKLGDKEKDNGLLLIVAMKQRKMRIEVGQGLEGDIPDAIAGRIIDGMKPYFKAGDFDRGILFATASIFQRAGVDLNNVDLPTAHDRPKKKTVGGLVSMLIIFVFFIYLFIKNPMLAMLILSGGRSSRHGGYYGGGGSSGGGFSGGGGGFSGGGASGDW